MANLVRDYKGSTVNASAAKAARGYLPQVCITSHNGGTVVEQIFHPSHPEIGFGTEDETLKTGMEYGIDAADGIIPGVDLAKLR